MKRNTKVILAVTFLALTALACQAINKLPINTSPVETNVPAPTAISNSKGDVLFSDDFSSVQWGTGTDKDSSVEYANEALHVIVFTKNYFVWSTPNDKDYDHTHIEVTVKNNSTDPTTAFGIMCYQQVTDGAFYYFAMTPAGEYAIAKAGAGQKDVFLTNNDEWAKSGAINQNASSYRVSADCGNGALTLYVDGQQIDSVSDSTYTTGGIALFTWSGQEATTTDVTFDDFLVTSLP